MSQKDASQRKIRVLYIISSLVVGGAEGQLVKLVTGLDREYYDVAVCCLSSAGPNRAPLDAEGIPVVTIGFRGFVTPLRHPMGVVRPLFNLVRTIRTFRPDIVHGFLFWAYVLGTFAARLARVPVVVTSRRSLGNFKAGNPRYLFLEDIANRLTDVIVANSEAVRQDTIARERLRPEKVVVVYNGIDANAYAAVARPELRESLGLAESGPVVGVIANLRECKGHAFFLEAWDEVVHRFPTAVALLIGDGPERAGLEAHVHRLGLGSSVRFVGTRRDVPDLLAHLDLVVHPSLEEGFPNAVLEAMAAGKPVVATRVGGIPEAVVDGVTGTLVPVCDSPALAKAMLKVIEDPDIADAYGQAGRERVTQFFDLPVMVSNYERLYEGQLSGKKDW